MQIEANDFGGIREKHMKESRQQRLFREKLEREDREYAQRRAQKEAYLAEEAKPVKVVNGRLV